MWLQIRMYLLMTILFGIVYSFLVIFLQGGSFIFYAVLASVIMFIQYLIGPKMVEMSMKLKYVSPQEAPKLHQMVEEMAMKAKMPKPKIAISEAPIPNAFAFGRWKSDGRVAVTRQIMSLLSEDELKAVIGHEISHLKNRDVATITMLSVLPMIFWYMAWSFMFSHGENRGNTILIGVVAFILYFVTNLLVLYGSRIREYYADRGSVSLGNKPHHLASALYKLVYGSARLSKDTLKSVEGQKAFFASDPSRAFHEFKDLKQVDTDLSGTIDQNELMALQNKTVVIGFKDKLMEAMSTHPNMVKRIKHLSTMKPY